MGSRSKVVVVAGIILALAGCSFAPRFSDDEKRELRDSASEYQQAVLEDLVVTEAEYRDAVDRTRSCVKDTGLGVGAIEQDRNQLGFTASYSGDNGPTDDQMRACYVEYLDPVAPIWVDQRTTLTR